ncbi:ferritin-like domain-containing protein [Ostreibacterium oceani]|uniref:DUF455 family protein n=1 Tax=Ostreibacterium oceani TaxID=2654998 RepID=A0A6N7F210_9GAMM|nr:ferritin-like domain-containing protein [Ostreibacterium oceani]MPV86828.1 DUF455 family protein [Ostreibacterium oceani]
MFDLNHVYQALMTSDILGKQRQIEALYRAACDHALVIEGKPVKPIHNPPLPDAVTVKATSHLSRRGVGSKSGHQSMLHAIAHIEYNAINLGLDAVYRFRQMPMDYYVDWLRVAKEEAEHFQLITARMAALDCQYGDFPVHTGLWAMCVDTEHDVMARMALVPRVMEARGLDVTPKIQHKLASIGDMESVEMLNVIYQDEIGHVAIGSRWFKYCCQQRCLSPYRTFRTLLKYYLKNGMDTAFNRPARLQAGFDDMELALLDEAFGNESTTETKRMQ